MWLRIPESRHIAYAIVLGMVVMPWDLVAPAADRAESKEQTASGTFVSFKDGTLTIKGKSALVIYQQVGANYKTFQNNEHGPGSKLVETVEALSRVSPGAVFHVDVEAREISFGVDHRVVGTFESYQDGKLTLLAADAPPGFIKKPTGKVALTIDRSTPVLASIQGGDYRLAGPAGEVLKTVQPGTMLTARSEYDSDLVEVIQIGEPKRKIERYIGQTRGAVRGSFVSFKEGILRIRGKGVTTLAANEYDRLISLRIAEQIPIVESIDGGAHRPAGAEALKTVKEGTIVTIRKIEEVILEIQIGVAKKN
jgi:hypothetical protein